MKLAVHQRLASMKPSRQCEWVSILQLELCQMKPSFPWRGSSCVLFRWQVYLCSIQWRALLSTRARRCSVGPEPKILQCGLLLRKALSPGSAESSQLCPDSASQELSHRKTWIYLEFRKSTDFKRRGGGGGLTAPLRSSDNNQMKIFKECLQDQSRNAFRGLLRRVKLKTHLPLHETASLRGGGCTEDDCGGVKTMPVTKS